MRRRTLPALVVPALLCGFLVIRNHTLHAREGAPAPTPAIHRVTLQPTATPPPTPLRTGGISYSLSRLDAIQQAADRGDPRSLYYRDPVDVTLHDLPSYGYRSGPIRLVSPPRPHPAPTSHTGEDGLPETDVIVRYAGRQYWIVLNQFVHQGAGGIWSIITITPM